MRIEKQMLNDALRVLGKAVYQTSPVELYRSVRFVGVPGNVRAMVTDGVEVVSVKVESDNVEPVDFCVEFKVLREQVRMAKVLSNPMVRLRRHFVPQHFPVLSPSHIKKAPRLRCVILSGGGRWIRTIESCASRFTVCPLWPLGNPTKV